MSSNASTVPTPLAEPLCVGDSLPLGTGKRYALAEPCPWHYGTRIELGSDTTARTKIRLRGSIFFYTPRSIEIAAETGATTVSLIYRGHSYNRQMPTPAPYRQPRAINWRWQ